MATCQKGMISMKQKKIQTVVLIITAVIFAFLSFGMFKTAYPTLTSPDSLSPDDIIKYLLAPACLVASIVFSVALVMTAPGEKKKFCLGTVVFSYGVYTGLLIYLVGFPLIASIYFLAVTALLFVVMSLPACRKFLLTSYTFVIQFLGALVNAYILILGYVKYKSWLEFIPLNEVSISNQQEKVLFFTGFLLSLAIYIMLEKFWNLHQKCYTLIFNTEDSYTHKDFKTCCCVINIVFLIAVNLGGQFGDEHYQAMLSAGNAVMVVYMAILGISFPSEKDTPAVKTA